MKTCKIIKPWGAYNAGEIVGLGDAEYAIAIETGVVEALENQKVGTAATKAKGGKSARKSGAATGGGEETAATGDTGDASETGDAGDTADASEAGETNS